MLDIDQFEERAAICEFDGGMSRFAAETAAAREQGLARWEALKFVKGVAMTASAMIGEANSAGGAEAKGAFGDPATLGGQNGEMAAHGANVAACGDKAKEAANAQRDRHSAGSGNTGSALARQQRQDDLPCVQSQPKEENRPMLEHYKEAGRAGVVLLALRT
ncbi:hypothetical protein [Paracoccus laeviglucosivorans]|uniref:Uncharacterized protein n=1 Tax=Paracoccus laeviglucosivorans TaxID=1197861 RepID=A0A521DDA0_9RHOB|nr:hypothetical protein [Paracoccus laeviglucosivorans]SMO69659.1 hypothetical protein SAMN06265221_107123 [Paracoccus laeviglucosivorans]